MTYMELSRIIIKKPRYHDPLFVSLTTFYSVTKLPQWKKLPICEELSGMAWAFASVQCRHDALLPAVRQPWPPWKIGAWKKIPLLFWGLLKGLFFSESVRLFREKHLMISQNHGSGKSAGFWMVDYHWRYTLFFTERRMGGRVNTGRCFLLL